MSAHRKRFLTATAAGVLLAALSTMPASAQTARFDSGLGVKGGEVTEVQFRRYGGYGYRGYGYRGGRGAAIGAGIAGLAAGAIIGGAIASQQGYYGPGPAYAAPGYATSSGDADAYCAQRYRSYDPASGTYLNYDGNRYPCP